MNTPESDDWRDHIRQAARDVPWPAVRDALRCTDIGTEAMTVTLPGPSGQWVLSLRRSWSRGRREQPCVLFASSNGKPFSVIIGPGKWLRLRAMVIGQLYLYCPFALDRPGPPPPRPEGA